ncbi:RDD family protein [Yoonia sp. I 8.24]|uniref:RDD family protein n=1 Tax=Yoonia sp. I 8.24 TaxID=1537229 RepID=UPI001EDE3EEE|nr:RDD family protein [Yoonia sp. I 8.24]MCG3266365.1 RDD family protein [Yoonia sp. I 8.24]
MTTYTYDPATAFTGVVVKRGIAWVFDMIAIGIICTLALPFTAFTGIFFFPFLMLVIGFFYRWITIANGSATWGMRMVGITLRDVYDHPLSSQTAFFHTLGYSISICVAPLQLISVILMLVSPQAKGLTDYLLGTYAVNRDI